MKINAKVIMKAIKVSGRLVGLKSAVILIAVFLVSCEQEAGSKISESDLIILGINYYAANISKEARVVLREDTENHFFDEGIDPFIEVPEVKSYDRYARELAASQDIDEALAFNFIEKNKQSRKLISTEFSDKLKVTVIARTEFDALFPIQMAPSKTGWMHFYERYPAATGITTVSKVAFSDDKRRAIMSIWFQSGEKAGRGCFLIFWYDDRLWKCKEVIDAPSGVS